MEKPNNVVQMPKPQHELVQLDPVDMHGPVETKIVIHVMVPDAKTKTMKAARLNFAMNVGVIPTRAEIKEVVDACLNPENMVASSIPDGTRLMTKAEFVAHVTTREAGRAIPMPGNQDYVPSTSEIPRQVLIHAIFGRGVPVSREDEFVNKGMAAFTGNQHNPRWDWTIGIEKLTDDELLALYKEIA